ncbi:hypothetical protein AUR64_12710 [Haloprofundus marisrubri]|uniref:Uncharacterized protein n=1 Tax=Haloprofundus marisrubri TaxID=1514971 RepID=A0A0W1RCS7_9EURY|nr:hypothetical protein [Haloprofundus marisrubri]KTG10419.1 hypothetical protein AUR64_12710 [Haloprofundus marisrubri]
MQRRTLIKSVAGIGGASALGFGGIAAFSGTAAANVTTNFSANEVTLTNDTGDLSKLFITPTFRVEWEGFDQPVGKVRVLVEARARGADGDAGEWSPVFRATPWINTNTEGTVSESAPATTGFYDTGDDGWGPITLFNEFGKPDYSTVPNSDEYLAGTSLGQVDEDGDREIIDDLPGAVNGYYGASGTSDVFDNDDDDSTKRTRVDVRYTVSLHLPSASSSFDGFGLDDEDREGKSPLVMYDESDFDSPANAIPYAELQANGSHPAVAVEKTSFIVETTNEEAKAGVEGETNAGATGGGSPENLSLTWSMGKQQWRIDNYNVDGSIQFTLSEAGNRSNAVTGIVEGGHYSYPHSEVEDGKNDGRGPNGAGEYVELDADTAILSVDGQQVDTKARGN